MLFSPSRVKKTRQNAMNAIFWVFLTFIGLDMVDFQDILDLINKKCLNGLKNEYDVQLGGHKFHKSGKNQKKQSV